MLSSEAMKPRLLALGIRIFAVLVAAWILRGMWWTTHGGQWQERWRSATAPREQRMRRELGERWEWLGALRRLTPEDAVVGVQFRPEALPTTVTRSMLDARFLAFPRRFLTPREMRRRIEEDPTRLNPRVHGLLLDPDATLPFAEAWTEIARDSTWRLLRWKGTP